MLYNKFSPIKLTSISHLFLSLAVDLIHQLANANFLCHVIIFYKITRCHGVTHKYEKKQKRTPFSNQSVFNEMKCRDMQGELDLVKLGDVLKRMGKYRDAETYYNRCLDQLRPDDHQNISACYYARGSLADKKGDHESSLEWFHQSLKIDMKTLQSDNPNIANTHNSIGNVYQADGDHNRALESYNKALKIF